MIVPGGRLTSYAGDDGHGVPLGTQVTKKAGSLAGGSLFFPGVHVTVVRPVPTFRLAEDIVGGVADVYGYITDWTVRTFDRSVVAPLEHAPCAYTSYSDPLMRRTVAGKTRSLSIMYAGVDVETPVALATDVKTIESTEHRSLPPKLVTLSSMNPDETIV